MKKILIIEDDLILLNLLKERVAKDGYIITTEKNGVSGLRTAETEIPDLIILDIVLPEMDGFTVLQKLKENKSTESVPVIIISNSGEPVEIEKVKKLGIADYLIKVEFDPDEVLMKIRKILGDETEYEINRQKEIKESMPEEKINRPKNGRPSVLIVEDDKFLRELISQKLNKEGMEIYFSITAEEALKTLETTVPHIILLDLLLPGINGFEFLKELKANPKISNIPVIILSNLGEEKDRENAFKLGAKDFLIKALYTPNEIVDEIKKILAENYL